MSATNWHVLRVAPGRERLGAVALQRVGAEAFLPGRRDWERKHWRSKKRILREHPLSAGYVFAGWHGWIDWQRVLDLDLVQGVLMETKRQIIDGREAWRREPYRLPLGWRGIEWRHAGGMENLLDNRPPPPIEHEIQPGDQVIVTSEVFDRYPAKCLAIEGQHARVLMDFFGGREVRVHLDMLARAGGDAIRSP